MRGASGAGSQYQISRSLRFNAPDTTYLSRTPASAGNRKTWTFSAWVKRSALSGGNYPQLMSADGGTYGSKIGFFDANQFWVDVGQGSTYTRLTSTAVHCDVSAWYHVVVAQDTTQATDTNRVKVYINGSQISLSGTWPTQNFDGSINNASAQNIGRESSATYYFNGYMTEVYMIDGQALTPSSFGETDTLTGVWKPKTYSGGPYGTNGFYLNFSDNSNTTADTLGRDSSGKGNNFTPNNFSVTADVGNDSVVDTPTPYGTDTGVGGSVRGNYCTLNPLFIPLGTTYYSITNGNLNAAGTSVANSGDVIGTISTGFTGKYYFESTMTGVDGSGYVIVGASDVQQIMDALSNNYLGALSKSYGYNSSGVKVNNNANLAYGATFATGDVIGVAIDCDNGAIYFSKNNTWQTSGVPTSGASKTGAAYTWTGGTQNMIPQIAVYRTGSIADNNFGQRAFTYTAPTGFKTLCTTNLPTPTIGATAATQAGKYFTPTLYTGAGGSSNQPITVGFQPDFVWLKARNQAYEHILSDSVRGAGKIIYSSLGNAEATVSNFVSFDSGGFTLNASGASSFNASAEPYVSWNWKGGGTAATNNSGSISSQVSVNPTAGFSVVTYTGVTPYPQTIGHGLGVAPSMIIIKNRSRSSTDWAVYHSSLGNTKGLYLNTTATSVTDIGFWNNTTPTSSVFSTGNGMGYAVNATTDNYVAYCFAPIEGYSAFGIYRGNGSTDGQFVHTGFKPAFVMIKTTTLASQNWYVLDSVRDTYNLTANKLFPNAASAENAAPNNSTTNALDFLSNGFKLRTTNDGTNKNGDAYIYACFAQNPFKYSLAR